MCHYLKARPVHTKVLYRYVRTFGNELPVHQFTMFANIYNNIQIQISPVSVDVHRRQSLSQFSPDALFATEKKQKMTLPFCCVNDDETESAGKSGRFFLPLTLWLQSVKYSPVSICFNSLVASSDVNVTDRSAVLPRKCDSLRRLLASRGDRYLNERRRTSVPHVSQLSSSDVVSGS